MRPAAHSDPDAQRHLNVAVADPQRPLEAREQPLADDDRLALVAHLEEHRELVPAEPRHGVAPAGAGGELAADGDQDRVAHRMAEAVVDRLEAVDVDRDDRDAAFDPPGAREGVLEPIHEERAVGQPGQGVVEGLVGELLLELLALGRVARVEDDAADARVGEQVVRDRLEVAPAAIAVAQPELDSPVRAPRLGERLEEGVQPRRVLRVNDVVEVAALQLVGGVAPEALHGGAGVLDPMLAVEDGDRLGRVQHERAEALLVADCLLVRGGHPLDPLPRQPHVLSATAIVALRPGERDGHRDRDSDEGGDPLVAAVQEEEEVPADHADADDRRKQRRPAGGQRVLVLDGRQRNPQACVRGASRARVRSTRNPRGAPDRVSLTT